VTRWRSHLPHPSYFQCLQLLLCLLRPMLLLG